MRYPRNVKIFRGQLDMMPVANVFFLLLIFILLASLVYTPGVSFDLQSGGNASNGTPRILTIGRNGEVIFQGQTNRVDTLSNLRAEFKRLPGGSRVVVRAEGEAPKELLVHIRDQARGLPIYLETPGRPIELPVAGGLSGTADRTLAVAVNLGGQLFFENRIISESDLAAKLKATVGQSKEPLTLMVFGDEATEPEVMVRLGRLAREAGVSSLHVVARPPKSS